MLVGGRQPKSLLVPSARWLPVVFVLSRSFGSALA